MHYNIGTIHLAAGRYGAAVRCMREAANWPGDNTPEALGVIAEAAVGAGTEAYSRHDTTMAVACFRAAHEAAPEVEAVQGLGRAVATQVYNFAARTLKSGAAAEAAEGLWVAHELDP